MNVLRSWIRADFLEKVRFKGLPLVRLQFLGLLAPRGTLDVQALGDAVVDCYEATLLDVVRDWHEASHLQLAESLVIPICMFVALPPGHVQIATDDVHGVAGIACLVDCSGQFIGACLRLLCVTIV